MKCINCKNTSKIKHTMLMRDGSVKRKRCCSACGTTFITYERDAGKTINGYEMRLVNAFRSMTKAQRIALWAHIRATITIKE